MNYDNIPKDGIYGPYTEYELLQCKLRRLQDMEGEPIGTILRRLNEAVAQAEKAAIEPEAASGANEVDDD